MSYEAYKNNQLGFTTRQLHAGYNPAEHYRSKAVPIYQTAAFELGDFERCIRLFDYSEEGHSYVRFSNPTNTVLERRLASLEGGIEAIALGSGMAAISNTFLNIAKSGDEIVAVNTLYGGSTTLLNSILPDYGIVGRFVEDENDIESYRKVITEKTKAIYIESLGNPGMNIIDIEAVANLAHEHGIPLIVDNTFATPYLLRPFEYGADVVCYSATKYLAGHGTTIVGAVVEKGGFDWLNGKFPQFEKFYDEYKDTIGKDILDKTMFTKRLRIRYLTDLGAHLSPTSAFYLLQGIETLSLRMREHAANAQKVAEFLEGHPKVLSVAYPGLKSNKYHELAKKYFPKGPGAIMSIRLKGGIEAARKVLEEVKVFDYMVNVGDAKSLIVHSATSTHFGQSKEEREKAGVYDDTLRLSIGIEEAEDLIADLKYALDSIDE
ncbi:MAG: O-acetylhomoserine aminocarboxypropyltransferase/cysteine synthase [Clostridium beijerinckii]|jgi:O-acetylhomoserine (thiol)-lyase|uniref:O-acetylhomoserine aminocarboxypropyltransferase/cysteine synthase family protein n=1 Tax=Clostridium beijerinckii TaxID=1520 RepID=UPI00098CCD8A|nr:O-acetylhomoserine aminocarboxypropyltransferase/cysteine synthase family protein [Clostridium beijerinckii]MCI1581026.1 O-acetylhomoserine aminocarboxypropyltransferase/cysteine synthase [Clostridium beijerinckii]MCI1584785.1 O-acetylhomoserine aminocarboxypropyltransferase/cysteine synthase [Clostridium beijerinckii]MCI1624512.1 O-acetylhomoserine aminocarboxypropyltransferase/cysteine synthase [Clostridium beijerinckii]NRT80152.1 O-acetylhomoserine (thiol)-lyase [Clostridium beijerinckii]